MRFSARPLRRLLVSLCLMLGAAGAAWARTAAMPTQTPQPTPTPAKGQPAKTTVPEPELAEARKVEAAADAPTRLTAAAEFLKKYPNSTLRHDVAELVAQKIDLVTDPAQRITLGESFRTVFTDPAEVPIATYFLLPGYIKTNRLDDAYKLAGTAVDTMPNPVQTMIELADAANAQVRQQNTQYVAQGAQYAGPSNRSRRTRSPRR